MGFPVGLVVKNLPANAGDIGDASSIPVLGRSIPWRRKRQPTPVFLPGKSHEEGSLVGYSLCNCKRVGNDLVTSHQQQNNIYV